ncbi:phage tail tape measure protein [Rhizobium laguerreae]|uniref:Phage tail tape measure protein n=1 Tax=Rhizobium laguerreae TaxID=1076926 RepID=A0AAX2QNJ2_9HYPH|nr:phage tail tape measure protein [Rhizobium laguerreae]TCU25283.1 hypothetical protein EV131_105397 [Rhizobium laguerreae]
MANAVIGALRAVLGLDSAAFDSGLDKAQSRLAKFGPAIKKGLAAASVAAVAAGAAIGASIKGAIDEADDLSKLASKIGVPIDELSRLKYAADLSGVSIDGVATGFKKLSTVMVSAASGNKAAAALFSDLGVSVTNADGSLRASSAVLGDVADKLQGMEDGAAKTALAVQLFGKSGLDLIPLLNGGAAGLKQMTDEADALGLTISAETGKAAEQFNDNISRLQATLTGLVTQITAALAPTLATITDYIVQASEAFRNLSPETQSFIAIGAALTVALGAIVVPLGLVVAGIVAIGVPAAAAGVAIAAVTAAVVAFWPQITAAGAAVGEFVAGAWAQFVAAWDSVIVKITAVKDAIAQFATDILAIFRALPGQMLEIGGQIIDGLWQGIQDRWNSVKESVTGIASGIKDSFTGFFDIHSPSKVMEEIGRNIMQGLGNGITGLKGTVVGAANGVATDVKGSFSSIEDAGSSMGSAFSGVFDGLIDGSKTFQESIRDLLGDLASMWKDKALQALFGGGGASGVAGNTGGLFGGLFSGLGSLFGFANGGSFQVGGAGGVDSQLVAFKASPNETVTVTKPGQTADRGMHVTFGVAADNNGNLLPFVQSVTQSGIRQAAPQILGQAKAQVMPTVGAYQRDRAGGDYRNGI